MPKSDNDIMKKKKKYGPIPLMNTDAIILNKILANWLPQYIRRMMHYIQLGFIPGT